MILWKWKINRWKSPKGKIFEYENQQNNEFVRILQCMHSARENWNRLKCCQKVDFIGEIEWYECSGKGEKKGKRERKIYENSNDMQKKK